MFILNSIAPIFLLIALGKILQKTGFFPDSFFKSLNRLVFWFALPALLISNISTAALELEIITEIMLLVILGTVASLGLAWLISKPLKLPAPSTGSFIQGSFRGNGAFIALPVIIYTLGDLAPGAESLGTIMLAPVVVLFNLLSVPILIHHGKEKHSAAESVGTFFRQLITNPLIAACAVGLALNLLHLELPLFLDRSLTALGKAALPLILISIGASLAFEKIRGSAPPALIASLIKTVAAPLFGFLLAGCFDLNSIETMIAIFYLAAPAAGMSYVMADVMDNDATLAGRIVALSTLLSAVTLPAVIALGL